jgi:hypothetical protein
MNTHTLRKIELDVLNLFSQHDLSRLLTKEIFQTLSQFASADLVRAFEDLEKGCRLIVRHTIDGHDWIMLTPEGARYAGVPLSSNAVQSTALPHPPKNSTSPPHLS